MACQVLAEASRNVGMLCVLGGSGVVAAPLEALEKLQWGKERVAVLAWVPQLDPWCQRLISH